MWRGCLCIPGREFHWHPAPSFSWPMVKPPNLFLLSCSKSKDDNPENGVVGNICGLPGWYLDGEIIKGRREFQDFCGRHEAKRREAWPQIREGERTGKMDPKGQNPVLVLSFCPEPWNPGYPALPLFQHPRAWLFPQSPSSSKSGSTTPSKIILKYNLCQSALFYYIFLHWKKVIMIQLRLACGFCFLYIDLCKATFHLD